MYIFPSLDIYLLTFDDDYNAFYKELYARVITLAAIELFKYLFNISYLSVKELCVENVFDVIVGSSIQYV
jgi:hypothetical protein